MLSAPSIACILPKPPNPTNPSPVYKRTVVEDVSDDEGEDLRDPWDDMEISLSPASNAIAVKWLRTARASLQRAKGTDDGGKSGMAARLRARDRNKSGKKSKTRRK